MSLREKIRSFIGTENLSFFKHSRNYISGAVVQNVLLALTIPILTRLLTVEEYGILSIFTSMTAILSILFGLNLRGGIVRYFLENQKDFDAALGTNLAFITVFQLVLFSITIFFRAPIAAFCNVDEEILVYASVVSVLMMAFETYLPYLAADNQSVKHSVLSVLRSASVLPSAILFILLIQEKKYLGRIWAELLVVSIFSGYAYWKLVRLSRFSFKSEYLRYTLRFSIPLIPHALSRYVLNFFDRIIIQQLTTATATGLYSFAYDVGMAMDLVIMGTGKAWRPIFFNEHQAGNHAKLERMAVSYANSIYLIAIAIILFAVDVVTVLADAKFFGALDLIPVVVLGYVFEFLYTLFFQYASYAKRTELISLATFIAGGVNIGLNYWAIPIWGYRAAAYATLVSFILLFFFHYYNARFVLRERVFSLRKLMSNLPIVAAVAVVYLLGRHFIAGYWAFLIFRIFLMSACGLYFHQVKKKADAERL